MIEIDPNPGPEKIRRFGLGLIVFGLILAGASLLRGKPERALVLAAGAAIAGSATALFPEPFGKAVFRAWMGVARPIGETVSYLVLGAVYFGLITPLGTAMRLLGRDALRLKRPPAGSCWTDFRESQNSTALEKLY